MNRTTGQAFQDARWYRKQRIAALLAGMLAAWCGSDVGAADSDREELDALRAEILKLIGPATCANLVHCRALALGSRPCGGPAEYLPYSSFGTNRDLLEAKAFEYTLLYEDVQGKVKGSDNCVMLPEPRLQCVDRHCRIEGR
jgi:hypothetical protein